MNKALLRPRHIASLEQEDVMPMGRLEAVVEAPRLRDYWRLVGRHRWKLLLCVLVGVLISIALILQSPPVYVARATLMIERKAAQVVKFQEVTPETDAFDQDGFLESQYQLLKSRSLAAAVIKSEHFDKDQKFLQQPQGSTVLSRLLGLPSVLIGMLTPAPTPPRTQSAISGIDSRLIDRYSQMIAVEPIKRSRLVAIASSSTDPELAARVANAHVSAYILQGFQLKSQANEEARNFLGKKLEELKTRVEHSESALNQFRREKGIISLDEKENIVVDRLADLNRKLTESEADRIGYEAQAKLIAKRQYDSLPAVISNTLIQNLKAQIVQLEAEHAKLSEQFLPGYPRLAQVKAQLEEARGRLAQQIKYVVDGIQSSYLAAQGKENSLRGEMNKQKTETFALKDAAVQYAILAREADTNKQLYDTVFERFREISVAGELPSSNVSIIDRAEIPRLPDKPNKRLMLLLGAVFGMFGGLGLALLMEHFDETMSTPEHGEQEIGLSCLAMIPDVMTLPRGLASSRMARLWANKSYLPGPAASSHRSDRRPWLTYEIYHKLRIAIQLSRSAELPKTILFTSAIPGEGKTTTAINTAIMFARMGSRVLLVDADMRQPRCLEVLRVKSEQGLADYLAGRVFLEEAIKPTAIANLSVLGAGSLPHNPTELIGSQKMSDLVDWLKESYDFIIFDSPPVIPVSDTVALAMLVEAVIFVVRGQATPIPVVKEALNQLNSMQRNVIGMVLNRVNAKSGEYRNYFRFDRSEDYYPSTKLN